MNKQEERVIKAALAVNNCVAEFDAVRDGGASFCSEHFDELQDAIYDYQRGDRFKSQIDTAILRLAQIETVAKDEAQPGRSIHIRQLLAELSVILGWIQEVYFAERNRNVDTRD